MTLLSVVKDVCADVGVAIPTSVFSGITGNRTMQEMLSLANEIAQRIAYDTREWNKLKKIQTFTGDGSKIAFDMPTDFKRMLLTTNVWHSVYPQTPLRFIPDTDKWLQRRLNAALASTPYGEWTMMGGQMLIYPAMGVGCTATFAYLNKNCVSLASSGVGDAFLADGDGFVLDERLLKLGMIWQWKAKKGTPYAEELGTFTDALAVASGADTPAPTIIGSVPISTGMITQSYPWPVPT